MLSEFRLLDLAETMINDSNTLDHIRLLREHNTGVGQMFQLRLEQWMYMPRIVGPHHVRHVAAVMEVFAEQGQTPIIVVANWDIGQ